MATIAISERQSQDSDFMEKLRAVYPEWEFSILPNGFVDEWNESLSKSSCCVNSLAREGEKE